MKQTTVGANGSDPAVSAAPGNTIIEDDWPRFLNEHMEELGWDNLILAAESGIDRSQVSRWRRGEGLPRHDKIRQVCAALRLDVRYGIVAAGYFTAEEMKLRRLPVREALRAAKPEQLAEELLSRIRGAEEPQVEESSSNGHGAVTGTYREQRVPIVSDPFTFQSNGRAR